MGRSVETGRSFLSRALVCACLALAMLAAHSAYQEYEIRQISEAAQDARDASPSRRHATAAGWDNCAEGHNARWLAACSELLLLRAQHETDPAHQAILAQAGGQAAARLIAYAPGNGENAIRLVMARSVGGIRYYAKEDSELIARSYALTPYSRSLGLWRIWYGARRWQDLAPPVRLALLKEALWYGRIGTREARMVLDALAQTQPFLPIAIRLSSPAAARIPLPLDPE